MKFTKTNTLQVKGIAILLMIFHHCFLNSRRWATVPFEMLDKVKGWGYYPISFAPFSSHTVQYLANFSKICVAMFVFMTGYGMYANYKQKAATISVNKYVLNRWISLMSGFLIIFILVQLLSIPTGRYLEVYGNDWKSFFYLALDGLGLGQLLKTPLFCLTWWYMSLAVVLIIIFPVFYKQVAKYSWIVLACSILIPRALGLSQTDLIRYLFAYTMGMCFAEKNLLAEIRQRLLNGNTLKKAFKFILMVTGMAVVIKCRQNAWIGTPFFDFWDGAAAAYVIICSYTYISNLGYFSKCLAFLGKHSMNIFLIHSFYRDVYFHEFTYSFYYAWLDYFVLLLVSLATSIVLEWFKRIIRYRNIVNKARNCLMRNGI